jgi:hypothetical protein
VTDGYATLVPKEITMPCAHSDAVISVQLVIDADPVRVYAPGLGLLAGALPVGAVTVIRSQCELWTKWLARVRGGQVDVT